MRKLLFIAIISMFISCSKEKTETPEPQKIKVQYEIYNLKSNYQFKYFAETWQEENITQTNYSKTVECTARDFEKSTQVITNTVGGNDSASLTATIGAKKYFIGRAKNGNGTLNLACSINDLK